MERESDKLYAQIEQLTQQLVDAFPNEIPVGNLHHRIQGCIEHWRSQARYYRQTDPDDEIMLARAEELDECADFKMSALEEVTPQEHVAALRKIVDLRVEAVVAMAPKPQTRPWWRWW